MAGAAAAAAAAAGAVESLGTVFSSSPSRSSSCINYFRLVSTVIDYFGKLPVGYAIVKCMHYLILSYTKVSLYVCKQKEYFILFIIYILIRYS